MDEELREKFLDPETRQKVIKAGYLGKPFDLTEDEIKRLLATEGNTLPEFAQNFIRSPERS